AQPPAARGRDLQAAERKARAQGAAQSRLPFRRTLGGDARLHRSGATAARIVSAAIRAEASANPADSHSARRMPSPSAPCSANAPNTAIANRLATEDIALLMPEGTPVWLPGPGA